MTRTIAKATQNNNNNGNTCDDDMYSEDIIDNNYLHSRLLKKANRRLSKESERLKSKSQNDIINKIYSCKTSNELNECFQEIHGINIMDGSDNLYTIKDINAYEAFFRCSLSLKHYEFGHKLFDALKESIVLNYNSGKHKYSDMWLIKIYRLYFTFIIEEGLARNDKSAISNVMNVYNGLKEICHDPNNSVPKYLYQNGSLYRSLLSNLNNIHAFNESKKLIHEIFHYKNQEMNALKDDIESDVNINDSSGDSDENGLSGDTNDGELEVSIQDRVDNIHLWNCIFEMYFKTKDYKNARKYWYKMKQEFNINPSDATLSIWIGGSSTGSHTKHLNYDIINISESIFKEFIDDNKRFPNIHVFNAIMKLYAAFGDITSCMDIIRTLGTSIEYNIDGKSYNSKIEKGNHDTPLIAIHALCNYIHINYDGIINDDVFDDFWNIVKYLDSKYNDQKTLAYYKAIIYAATCCHGNKGIKIIMEYYHKLTKNGFTPTFTLFDYIYKKSIDAFENNSNNYTNDDINEWLEWIQQQKIKEKLNHINKFIDYENKVKQNLLNM